jgi:hypothetical protein
MALSSDAFVHPTYTATLQPRSLPEFGPRRTAPVGREPPQAVPDDNAWTNLRRPVNPTPSSDAFAHPTYAATGLHPGIRPPAERPP